ncbi:MAG: histidine ammonia-lyase [Acidimicrobiia bacterium]|nr:histidine ammonia-lyase [Acidimicrobiia bacterium]MDH5521643.1 histidine ammonia-lyase [Acidimicrobiia bacterium]
MTVTITGGPLSIDDVVAVARGMATVEIDRVAFEKMAASRAVVEGLAHGEPTYGVSTGFGALATVAIPEERRAALQVALVRSHAAGIGDPVETEVVRAMTLLRARTIAMGYSGARPSTASGLVDLLNNRIHPVVREFGSLGASGDLAPLAHVALALIGEGEVEMGGSVMVAGDALAAAGLEPIVLVEKEGLALTNGTDGILGMLCMAVTDARMLLDTADAVAALTTEAMLATDRAFADDLQRLRPQPGQAVSATNLRMLLKDSPLVASHRHDDPRVQDAYSIRCTPQVHGAARDTLDHALGVVDNELAAAIDNPMVLPDGRVESCGNFHGAPLGYVADFMAIALTDVGMISERRMDRVLDKTRNHGLPPFLAADPGVDSGLMIGHYTAAGICEENRRLAMPSSVDSYPTSGMQEDHVSMAWNAARKLRRVVDNLARILAIELVIAARGVELRHPIGPAPATSAVVSRLRETLSGPGPDRYLSPELRAAEQLVRTGEIRSAAFGG